MGWDPQNRMPEDKILPIFHRPEFLLVTITTTNTTTDTTVFNSHFQGEPGLDGWFLSVSSSTDKITFEDAVYRFLMGRLSFLSPNQQHQSAEGNSKH